LLTRLVATQRTQIGLLKAFGRSDARAGLHYLLLASATVVLGMFGGLPLGLQVGALFVDVYRGFFHFPRRALERHGLTRRVPSSLRMILRHLLRRPWKAAASALGMALAVGLMVLGHFVLDTVNCMMAVQFNEIQHDDLTVLYNEPRGPRALTDIARLEGVVQAEPFRIVPAWLRHEHRSKRIEVIGLAPNHQLRRLLDSDLRAVDRPHEGLVLNDKLARVLGVRPGDHVTMEVLEGVRPVLQLPVVRVVDELLGLGAYMDANALSRALNEDATSSGAYLRIEADAAPALYARLKQMPAVGGVAVRQVVQASIRQTMDRSFLFFAAVQTLFASVIVAGMVHNSARLALAERGNELASLGVLGFTQREIGVLLLGEQALLVPAFDREMFRLPLVVGPWSYGYAVAAALAAFVLSGLIVTRRIRDLDLIAVLKTHE
jgi:putative ABC transport system permease protein